MEQWQKHIIADSATVGDALAMIDDTECGFSVVVNNFGEFVTVLADTTMRKLILQGVSPQDSIASALSSCANTVRSVQKVLSPPSGRVELKNFRTREGVVVKLDAAGRPEAVEHLSANSGVGLIPVILMLGGNGNRLRPLTDHCPKPLLKVGGKPLLERTLESLIEQRFKNLYFSVNYKAELIEEFFGDGSRWGAEIKYLREKDMLGTAGSLRLLPEFPHSPIVVMNGDLFSETQLPVVRMLEYHKVHRADATMAVAPYEWKIPYGVVETNGEMLTNIREKPTHVSFINAGMYVLQPEVLALLPEQGAYDMPSLFEQLMIQNGKTCAFPLREEWVDIGSIESFEKICQRF